MVSCIVPPCLAQILLQEAWYAGNDGEGVMLFTVSHELTHFIKRWSPAKYKVLANFLMKEYSKAGESVDALVKLQLEKAEANGRTLTYEQAYDEVIANSMESMLSDGSVMEKLAKLKAQDRTLWQKIKSYITDLVAKIRNLYKGIDPQSYEGMAVSQMKDALERLQELFTEGLVDASENYRASLTPGQKGISANLTGEPEAYSAENSTAIKHSSRDYSYAALTAKPDMVVTTVGGQVPNNRADVVAQAKKNAAKVGEFNPKDGSVSIHVDDNGADIIVGTDGLKHGLRRTNNPQVEPNYIVTVKAGEILKNSIQINEATPKKESASESYVLIGAAQDANGDIYVVRSVINQFNQSLESMDALYAMNAKKEPAATKSPRSAAKPLSVTGSAISIADLLDIVNRHFPQNLPEDVLKHYGYSQRPDGDMGNDMLYSSRDGDGISNRSLLVNALEGVARNDMEKAKLQEYKDKIDFINSEEARLRELNSQIKELSFAKGPRDKAKIQSLRDEATKTANRINISDKQL